MSDQQHGRKPGKRNGRGIQNPNPQNSRGAQNKRAKNGRAQNQRAESRAQSQRHEDARKQDRNQSRTTSRVSSNNQTPANRRGHQPPQTDPRLLAYDVLRDVDDREAYGNLALQKRLRRAHLQPRDAAFATELVSGTLRFRLLYDAIIAAGAGRDSSEIDGRTRNILRLGAHQLLQMRVPSHAAVNEMVDLQRRVANKNAAGFVNGVLRRVAERTLAEWITHLTADASEVDALALTHSHPGWIVRALRDALRAEGRETELPALLSNDNTAPKVQLAVLPTAGVDPETLSALALDTDSGTDRLTVTGVSPYGLQLEGGEPQTVLRECGVNPGAIRVQDQGSQLAALALIAAKPLEPGEKWLDLCAGPGGKAALLAAEAHIRKIPFRANEAQEHRAELVRQALAAALADPETSAKAAIALPDSTAAAAGAQLPPGITVSHADGRTPAAYGGADAQYSRILVDAPCSGLGALRRRPEARWRKQPGDIPPLRKLQEELLAAAAQHLAPGGVLAYVTCSPHLAETQLLLKRFLSAHPVLRPLAARDIVQRVAREPLDLGETGDYVQLWPHRHGTDAMFIALLQRVA